MPPTYARSGLYLALAACLALAAAVPAKADEATIRKVLAERLPKMPRIDEVSRTPIPGLFEVRMGTELFYTDATGEHVIQGAIIETRTRTDLTQARIDKLTAVDFSTLPLKDAILIKQGNGARKVAVFARPADAQGRVDLHVSLPDPRPRLDREVARHLVCQGRRQGMAGVDGRWHRARESGR
jgi:hypothetical protein